MRCLLGLVLSLCCLVCGGMFSVNAADEPVPAPSRALLGRWDLTVAGPQGAYPSWIEVKLSGRSTLVGSYVGQFGSARPVAKFEVEGSGFRFVVPPQWENRTTDVVVEGKIEGDTLSGTVTGDRGEVLRWTGRRAPDLKRTAAPK